MPCQSDYMDDGSDDGSSERAKEKIDTLTQNLCFVCGELTYIQRLDILSPRIKDWWKDHQQSDTDRVHQQMLNIAHHHDDAESLAKFFLQEAERVHPVSRYHKEWFQNMANVTWEEKSKIQIT